ncbi:MAG: puuB 1 [Verrucomicrobiales bacterium]|nr:puuB 1 [Verrucomicrobiales bacterium]
METTSFWLTSTELPKFPTITSDLTVDVVIVGGGMTGISTAYLLKQAGVKVALLERETVGGVDSSYTTAHVTAVTDERLYDLSKHFGKDGARAAWDAGYAAIDQIHQNIRNEQIQCDFKWIPGYLTPPWNDPSADAVKSLKKDAKLAQTFGYPAEFVEATPHFGSPGVKFADQARFHPLKYLAALVRKIPGDGSYVFEHSPAEDFNEKAVKSGQYKIRCDWIVLATHTPRMGKDSALSAMMLQTKLALYNTYVLGAEVPRGRIPDASFWDTSEPYNYLRLHPQEGSDFAILGGEDHKTGEEENTEKPFERLRETFLKLVPDARITHRWSGQVIETSDGLPFIGETEEKQFIATGYAGNGMTFGTLSSLMARDAITGEKNPWSVLFDPHRKKLSSAGDYLRENKDYPYYYLRDRLAGAEDDSVEALQIGQGKILKLAGEKVAAYRDENGKVTTCSPVCTHLGCIVNWNEAEKTWDCPCHGSRFKPTGEVMAGPAEAPLEKMPLPIEAKEPSKKRKKRELVHAD